MKLHRDGADVLRIVAAGSVDDGKSTLIGRLLYETNALPDDHLAALCAATGGEGPPDLAFATDGLRAEREEGVTIDVAYRYLTFPTRRFVLADAPGHEQYTANMATAASRSDLALQLVDVTRGLTTQTKRHAYVCALFGVASFVVVVNKMDMVAYAERRFRDVEQAYREFAARLGIPSLTCIPVSALAGENVVARSERMPWYAGSALLPCLRDARAGQSRNTTEFRLPVQRVIRAPGVRSYAGLVASGVVKTGDAVVVVPGGHRSRVKMIAVGAARLDSAVAGQSVAVTLADDIEVQRGDILSCPEYPPAPQRAVETLVAWNGPEPLTPGQMYWLKHASGWVKARCEGVDHRVDLDSQGHDAVDALTTNEIGRARFALHRDLFVDEYRRNRSLGSLTVVSVESNLTLGAATIVRATRDDAEGDGTAAAPVPLAEPAGGERVLPRRRGVTLWLTGLSGAGKSTIAEALERRLNRQDRAAIVVDGDALRAGLCSDLGFTARDRGENVRRAAEVARFLNASGLTVMVSLISPFRTDRDLARHIVGAEHFLEIYVSTPIDVCEARDPKGLYRLARSGRLPEFTGLTSPYEPPESPAVTIDTAVLPVDACVDAIVHALRGRGGGA